MPLEKAIVKSIINLARKRGWWIFKVHGGPFQDAGIPDLHLEKYGHALWFEVKQPGKKPTVIQRAKMKEIHKEGGSPCHVVTTKEEADILLDFYEKRFSNNDGAVYLDDSFEDN